VDRLLTFGRFFSFDNYTFRSAIWTYQFLSVFQIADLNVSSCFFFNFRALYSHIWRLCDDTNISGCARKPQDTYR